MTNRPTSTPDSSDLPLVDLLFNRATDPMWVLDVTGCVVRANDAARAAFTSSRPVFAVLMEEALDEELPRAGHWTAEIPVLDSHDGVVHMLATLSSMNDASSHFLCTVRNEVAARLSDSSLHAVGPPDAHDTSEAHQVRELHDVRDDGPSMMWMAGVDAGREWFSKPWLDFIGAADAGPQGEAWLDSVHLEDVERLRGIVEASTRARYPFTLDYRLRRHDGAWRWVMDSGLPRYAGDGSFCGYVGSCIDIHDRKELEDKLAERTRALRLADRRKDEFLAMLSHELRNPLAPIANAAGLLRLMEKDNPALGRVRVIVERQVEQLRRLISDMVDMTRLTQHKMALTRQPVCVATLIAQASAGIQARIDSAGHSVDVIIDSPEREVVVDPARFQQAIASLISNAAKFMQRPGVISIEAGARGDVYSIRVSDHGDGIQPDFLPHVFDLFAQQDQSLARTHGGLGVGLSIARRIVQLHGGDIEARSEGPGRGAEFTIHLPIEASDRRMDPAARHTSLV